MVEYLKQNGAAKESIQSVASQAIDTNNFEQVVRTMLRVDKIMKTGEKIQAMVNQKIVNVGDVISVQTNGCMHYFKVRNIDIQKQSVQFERPHSIPVDYDPFATTPVHKSTSEKPFFDPKDTVEAGVNTKDKQGSTATPPPPGFVLDGVIWSDITTPIHEAATHGNLADVERYLKNGTAVDARDKIGKTPLMEAGSLPVAAFLVNKGADVNARSTDGWTPLMLAAGNGRLDVVKYLVDKGANVNAQDKGDWTPLLSAACEGGEMDMVKYLVSKGANVNARSKTGQSALTLATDRKKQDIVEFLKQHGAKE